MKTLIIIGFIVFVLVILGLNLWIDLLNEKIIRLLKEEIEYLKQKLAKYENSI